MTKIDLLTPVVPEDRWHPNFKRIVEFASPEELAVLSHWARGFVDRDGKLVREFQATFNSTFWELYLHALFRDAGCAIDFQYDRPDFVVTDGPFGPFLAEAVIASNPSGGMPEWANDLSGPPTRREDMLDLAGLRLTQGLVEKHRKWREGYSALPHCATLPFIVCIAPFEQPGGHIQGTKAIDRVLFGGPRPFLVVDDEGKTRVLGHSVTSAAYKPSGASVQFGMFTTPAFSEISAVLFSSLATWSKVHAMADRGADPMIVHAVRWSEEHGLINIVDEDGGTYSETLVHGAHLFLNPHASRPLDPAAWRAYGFGVHYHHPEGTYSDVPDGLLFQRRVYRVRGLGPGDLWMEENPPPAGATAHKRQPPPDGVFFGGPSTSGLTDSIELVMYKGWTLYVGRDIVDNDWNSMAKSGVHLSLEEFRDAEEEPWMGLFVATREEAVAQARRHVDEELQNAASEEAE